MILASCSAWSVFGDFLSARAIESAIDFASTLDPAVERAVSSLRTGEAGRRDTGDGAATGDMLVTALTVLMTIRKDFTAGKEGNVGYIMMIDGGRSAFRACTALDKHTGETPR